MLAPILTEPYKGNWKGISATLNYLVDFYEPYKGNWKIQNAIAIRISSSTLNPIKGIESIVWQVA